MSRVRLPTVPWVFFRAKLPVISSRLSPWRSAVRCVVIVMSLSLCSSPSWVRWASVRNRSAEYCFSARLAEAERSMSMRLSRNPMSALSTCPESSAARVVRFRL